MNNIFIIGDKRKFLTALFTLKSELIDGLPSSRLALPVIEFFKELRINKTQIADVKNDLILLSYINKQLELANLKMISHGHNFKKFIILQYYFTIQGGEFTPTMKFK